MSDQKTFSIIRFVIAVVLILFLVGIIGIIWKYTNGGNESFKTFTVRYGDKQILSTDTETNIEMEGGTVHLFEVNYTLDIGTSEPRDYIVKVMPNTNLDFSFTVDGKKYQYANAKEFTSAFKINKEASSFTIFIPEDLSLKTVLKTVYGKTVEVDESNAYPYTLVVSSYNEKVTYRINFRLAAKSSGGDNSNQSNPSTPSDKPVQKYGIEWDNLGSGGDIRFECVKEAAAGETVTFSVTLGDHYYSEQYTLQVGRVALIARDFEEDDDTTLGYGEGTYSFTMPASFVTIMIYTVVE